MVTSDNDLMKVDPKEVKELEKALILEQKKDEKEREKAKKSYEVLAHNTVYEASSFRILNENAIEVFVNGKKYIFFNPVYIKEK